MNHREKVWQVVAEYLPPMNNEDLRAMVDELTTLVTSEFDAGIEHGQRIEDD